MRRLAVRGYAVPIALDHGRELFIGRAMERYALAEQLVAPSVEEGLRVGGVGVIPQLLELLAQEVGDVETRVGLQKPFEVFAGVVGQVFSPRQQHIALAFDEASILAGDALVFLSVGWRRARRRDV